MTSSRSLARPPHLKTTGETAPPGAPEVWAPAARPLPARQTLAPPVRVGAEWGGSEPEKADVSLLPATLRCSPFLCVKSGVPLDREARAGHTAQKHPFLCVWRNEISPSNEIPLKTSLQNILAYGLCYKVLGVFFVLELRPA